MFGVGRDLWGPPAQPPAQAGSPTAGCAAPRPGGAGISPEKETPQPPWAAWARAPAPSEGRSSSSQHEKHNIYTINPAREDMDRKIF